MTHELVLEIQSQPSDTACGPTCLAAVYDYWNQPVDLDRLIGKISELDSGGTLAVDLACDALRRGFAAEIVTYNPQLFDPTWFDSDGEMKSAEALIDKLTKQLDSKKDASNLTWHDCVQPPSLTCSTLRSAAECGCNRWMNCCWCQ